MNQQSKRAIKALVLELRHSLEDDIAVQLKRYGYAGGRWIDPAKLPHIWNDDAAMADRQRMDAALAQELRRMGVSDPADATAKQREEAVGWFVREIAYTHLNRLVALKALEVRGLIPEVITTRDAYGGRSRAHYDLRNAHAELARGADEGLAEAIRQVSRLVHRDFRLLFDVGDAAEDRPAPVNTLVWPSHTTLRAAVAAINGLDARAENDGSTLWLEDEIIGWLYQFYNAEQKEAIRSRGKPRRPAEVAVINQFFTPRWVVKFLVDNTLGRLWLEMHPDSERVRTKCDYLVPEPLSEEETGKLVDWETRSGEASQSTNPQFTLDPDSPINNPHAAPRRPARRPQEIRLIDPACGTMHFGHYAFEVFQEIYRDAREKGWVARGDVVPDEEVPAAILRCNLYGVDIDLRAVQLAGLSLYMKARTAEAALGLDGTRVNQVNLVVADAVLPEDGPRSEFLKQYGDNKPVQRAVAQVLDEMANVAEVGSLLRVEERLRQSLADAGYEPPEAWSAERQRNLPGMEPAERQLSLADAPGVAPEQWGAHYTVARLLEDLRAFAARALRQHDVNAQLFAQEASKGVRLLDVFLNDYDAVVMNPPYGSTTDSAKLYLGKAYPETKNDLYAAFIDRGLDLSRRTGYVGAFVSRTFMFLSSFERFRKEILLQQCGIVSIAEAGLGVLDDATVRPAAVVLSGNPKDAQVYSTFYRLPQIELEEKENVLKRAVQNPAWGIATHITFIRRSVSFTALPKSPFTYWASEDLLSRFQQLPPLDRDNLSGYEGDLKVADVKEGLGTRDDARFVRFFWEVRPAAVGAGWYPFAKGGDCLRYYKQIEWIVNWGEDGTAIKQNITDKYPYLDGNYGWLVKNTDYYFLEGTSYTRESEKAALGVYHMPEGCIFADKGPGIFFRSHDDLWWGMGVLNSALVAGFLRMLTPDRSRPIGLVSSFPVAIPDRTRKQKLEESVSAIYQAKFTWDTGNELCTRFKVPWLVQASRGQLLAAFPDLHPAVQSPTSQFPNLGALLDYIRAIEAATDARLQALQAEIDEAVYGLYEISLEDRVLIERELGERPPELVWPEMERKSDREKRREHVRRLISWCLLEALKADPDGILTLDEAVAGVRAGLEAEFGEDAAFRLEADIKDVLGRDVRDWLDGPFCKWHTQLYKRTPIVWQLSSDDSRNTFNLFVYYHKLDADTLRKVQTLYLWPARRRYESQRGTAAAAGDPAGMEEAELALEALAGFEARLVSVIEGKVDYQPPEWAEGPFRGGVYDPVCDDGVQVNLMPLQEAGLLRYRKLI